MFQCGKVRDLPCERLQEEEENSALPVRATTHSIIQEIFRNCQYEANAQICQ